LVVAGCFVFYNTVFKGLKAAKRMADEALDNAKAASEMANRDPLVVDAGDKSDFDKKMETILQYMDYYYNGEIDMDKMYDAMLHAAVNSLGDPYSVYYSPDEYSALLESSSGIYSGIGATISQDMTTKAMTIVTPFTNSPAYNAGLCSGDQIIGVDGESVIGEDLSDVVTKIKGLEGTSVNITILRDGEEITFTVTRAKIEVEFVSHKMLEDNIGYILVSEFEETTADQFSAAIADLQKQGMKGLVVDIRNNPGGLYNIVCEMLDRILPKGDLLVYTEDKYGRKAYNYAENTDTLDMPIAVIVNGNSASASEIFSGALQDHGKAVIVGTQSFGKGIVQSVIPILYDGSGVKLTSSRYFTPNGVCIHGTGITPDVVVELEEGLEKINIELRDHDNQIDAAVKEVKKLMR
ncbi:MAG: S41 family peptidase, partial [Lachnospiraceae bacterium]|nr:S41 family peptidase [Lachnospiraceae bacterium]